MLFTVIQFKVLIISQVCCRHDASLGYSVTCVITLQLQDLRYFKSEKTSRGILQEGWRDTQDPIMCSYKLVSVKFEVWGLQTRVEQFVHKVRRQTQVLIKYIFQILVLDEVNFHSYN